MKGAVARCGLLQGIYQLFRRDICLYRRSLIALEARSCVMVIVVQSFIAELFKLRLDFTWHSLTPLRSLAKARGGSSGSTLQNGDRCRVLPLAHAIQNN